ncbi:MAG: hypothetical protein KatS3mg082_1955 [Nitrospiraceae bacterium]|nr:MAG: hypothetical protein KatS3mg082_1955 [Nitrospiraceae bacterium]
MTKPNSKNKPPENRALSLLAASVELEAAPAEGDVQKLRRFTMTAYTGGAMQLAGWRYPVVVDLQGLQIGRQRRPILLDHQRDVDFVMGQTDSVAVMNDQLIVAGHVMGDSPKARQVIALADKGFAWQASIGARAEQVEFVPEGKTSQANGREFAGPVNVARRATLGEISFVVLGADENTSAQIAAEQPKETKDMDFARDPEPTEHHAAYLRCAPSAAAERQTDRRHPQDLRRQAWRHRGSGHRRGLGCGAYGTRSAAAHRRPQGPAIARGRRQRPLLDGAAPGGRPVP